MSRRHMLVLSMRTPTAKLIERAICDGAYELLDWEITPKPTPLQRELAKAIDLNMRVGKTRCQIAIDDRIDLIEEFRHQIACLARNEHPWLAGVHSHIEGALERLLDDIDKFRSMSAIEKVAAVGQQPSKVTRG